MNSFVIDNVNAILEDGIRENAAVRIEDGEIAAIGGAGSLKADETVDPKGSDSGDFRIIRGGYWRGWPQWCRSGYRGYGHPKAADDRRGFRMAMDE